MTSSTRPPGSSTTPGCTSRAAPRPEVAGRQLEQVGPVEADLAAADPQPPARVAEQGERHGGLARSRLADQAKHFPGAHVERDPADDVGAGRADPDLEVPDVQPDSGAAVFPAAGRRRRGRARPRGKTAGHRDCPGVSSSRRTASSGRRSTPIVTRAMASENVLVPIVSRAISTAGTITAHGFSGRPLRFSLIIRPQLAAGGAWPKPRKASPAMITIE